MSNDKLNFKLLNLLILLVICYLVISTFNWWSGVIERFISIIFPFIRSQVSLLTTQPGITPIMIPPINLNSLIDSEENEE